MIYSHEQQTPNPEAQVPALDPPLVVHSAAVKHTPASLAVVLQASLGKRTTWKMFKTGKNKIEKKEKTD